MLRWVLALACLAAYPQVVKDSFWSDPGPLDLIQGDGMDQFIFQALTSDALVGVSPEGEVVPRLAIRWKLGPQSIRFDLRGEARFLDGQLVRPADVVWTFTQIQQNPRACPSKKAALEGVACKVGATWVEVKGPRRSTRLLRELAMIPIAREGLPGMGSGPYSWWRKGDVWHFQARSHHLKPKIRQVQFRIIGDDTSLLQGLRKGWLTLGIPPSSLRLKPPEALRELRQPMHGQVLIWSRLGPGTLRTLESWRNEPWPVAVLGSRASPSRGLWPETLGFPPRKVQVPAVKADGLRWEVLYAAGDRLVERALMVMKERARRDGAHLELRPLEGALLMERLQKGEFQMACGMQVYQPHPWSVLELMDPGSPMNFCAWGHPGYAELVEGLEGLTDSRWDQLQALWAGSPTFLPLLDMRSTLWIDKRLEVAPGPMGIYLSTPGVAGWRWVGQP